MSPDRRSDLAAALAQRGRRIVLVATRDVLYAVAEDKLVLICTPQERLVINRTITGLEALLGPGGFVRASRATLVNLAHARELMPSSSGTWTLKLSNGVEIGVSRARIGLLRSRVGY